MAEEPDAGGHSSDDESADAAGGDEEPPVDGGEPAERDGGSVDSEVESQEDTEGAGGSTDEAESDGGDHDDGSTDGSDGPRDEGEKPNGGDDGSAATDDSEPATDEKPRTADEKPRTADEKPRTADREESHADDEEPPSIDGESPPIGAVTDAGAPPSESAPGVDENGSEGEAAGGNEGESGSSDDAAAHADDSHPETPTGDEVGQEAVDPEADGDAVGPVPEDLDDPASEDDAGDPIRDGFDWLDAAADAETEAATVGAYDEMITDEELGTVPPEETDDVLGHPSEGPPDDEEMPLADHIEEMVLRLAVVCAVAAVVAGTVFFFEPLAEDTIMFIWQSVIPHHDVKVHPLVGGSTWPGHYVEADAVGGTNPRVYGPLELKLTELKFASLVGFVLALPVFVYETYRFMRPGLYPNERRYYLAAVPTSLVLAFVGVAFAYFIILPAIFAYFVRYSERAGVLAFALRQTFDLILVLMGYMALVFQIPLFIMLAIMMGLTDRLWLEERRLYFWGGFLGVSFLFVPEPTGMAPILVALTMVGLFEGTLALLRWTGN